MTYLSLCVEILETAEILTFWPTDSIWVMICLEMTISSCKMFYHPLSSWVWVSVFNSVVEIWELRNVVRDDFDIFHTYCLLTNSNYLLPSAKSQLVHWFLMRILFMKYLCSFLQMKYRGEKMCKSNFILRVQKTVAVIFVGRKSNGQDLRNKPS